MLLLDWNNYVKLCNCLENKSVFSFKAEDPPTIQQYIMLLLGKVKGLKEGTEGCYLFLGEKRSWKYTDHKKRKQTYID